MGDRSSLVNRIVRYRALVQDILDKEFYNAVVEEVDAAGNRRTISAHLQDSVTCSPSGEYIDFDSAGTVIMDRYFIIPSTCR